MPNYLDWSPWREIYAWYPRKVPITYYKSNGNFSYKVREGHRWMWLKRYWIRSRKGFVVGYEGIAISDYETVFSVFDMLKRSS
jgi:hypothetical protein